jgi:hypothetical protein
VKYRCILLPFAQKRISAENVPRKSSDRHTALHLLYGKIGIPAVAAAARYQSGAKNPELPLMAELNHRGAAIIV